MAKSIYRLTTPSPYAREQPRYRYCPLQPQHRDTDYLRAKSGANILGVNAGIVQNTRAWRRRSWCTVDPAREELRLRPAASAPETNGLVSSTLGLGSTITSFDPVITGTLQLDKDDAESVSVFSPIPVIAQNTYTSDLAYTQGFAWGTSITADSTIPT